MKALKSFFQQLLPNKIEHGTAPQVHKFRMVGLVNLISGITCIVSGSAMYYFGMTSYLSILLLGLVCFLGWLLNRAGYPRSSAVILVITLLAVIQYNIFQGYGMHDVGIIAWPAIIFFVGLFFGSRTIPYITTFIMLLAVATKIIPNAKGFTGYADTGDLVVMLLITVSFSLIGLVIIRKNEETLQLVQRSDERFHLIFNSINDGIFIHDAKSGAILDANEKALDLFGYTRSEILQMEVVSISSGIPPYAQENALEWINKTATQGAQHFEWHAKEKSGRLFWVDVNMKQTVIDQLSCVLVSLRDITERMQTEEALHETQELLALFMQHSPIYTYIKAVSPTDDRLLLASENMRELIGISSDQEMLGKTMEELFPPEFAVKIHADDLAVVTRGEMLKQDEDLNGRHYTTIKFPLTQAGKTLLAGYTIDITERKQFEDEIRETQENFELIFHNSPSMTIISRLDDARVINVNDSFTKISGFSREEIIGKTTLDINLWKNPEQRIGFINELRQKGHFEDFEIQFQRKDGCLRIGLLSARTTTLQGTSVSISTTYDITERKNAETALVESQALTAAIVESTSDLIWSVDPENYGLLTFNSGLSNYFLRGREIAIKTGMRPEDLFPPGEFVQKWRGFYQRALTEGSYSIEYCTFSGTVTLLLTFNILKRNDTVFGISVFGRDITEDKKAD